ncbi:uncharacterized protein LOC142332634 isoform X2 [Lycorma delicatula]|uniref:uncharacterized protein LOC142332634 isoform X2 n=1 Tax=Lycorma delicatula TaxID=130591 RepID=UPI003F516F87
MIFQLNIILSISVLILNLFNYTDGSNISNDDYFSYNTKQTANPTSRNSSNQWGLDTDTGSANARASRGVNNSSYNYPSTKQANDAATLTESPSMRGLRGLKFGNSLSTTSNSNLDQGYNSKASLTGSDDGAKYTSQYENPQTKPARASSGVNNFSFTYPPNKQAGDAPTLTESPSTRGLRGLKFGNSLSTTSNSNLDQGYNSKAPLTGSNDGAKYTSQYENPQTKPQTSFYSRVSNRIDSPANQEVKENRNPFNPNAGMIQAPARASSGVNNFSINYPPNKQADDAATLTESPSTKGLRGLKFGNSLSTTSNSNLDQGYNSKAPLTGSNDGAKYTSQYENPQTKPARASSGVNNFSINYPPNKQADDAATITESPSTKGLRGLKFGNSLSTTSNSNLDQGYNSKAPLTGSNDGAKYTSQYENPQTKPARASSGVNNFSINYPPNKQADDAATITESPSTKGLRGLKFGNSLSTTSNSNLDQGYNSKAPLTGSNDGAKYTSQYENPQTKPARASSGVNNFSINYPPNKQADDAATITESPSTKGLRGLKFGNSLSTTSNSNLDQGYNSKAPLTGSNDGAKYTSQYENPQTKPQTSFYSRVSNRIDSPANQEVKENRNPFNPNAGMIQAPARASSGVNNFSFTYPPNKQADDAATLTESPSTKGLRGLKFGNSLSTTSNSNLDQGYNSKASLTGSDEGAKYTSQYENPQTKPQSSFYSRDSSRVDSPANQENNRFPLNRTVGMQQTRVQTNPAVNRNSAYPATQPLSLTGTFNQSAGVKPMQQGLTATTPRTQLPTNGYNTSPTNDLLSNLKKSGVYQTSELIPTAKKLMTPIYEDEDSSKLIPNVNVVLELNQKMQEVQPKYFTAEKMYKNGELNSKAGNTCLPDPLEDDLKDQDRWKIYQCSNVLNDSQIQTLFNIRKRSFKITIKETNAQEIMYCDITDSLGFDDVDFVWTSVVPKEGPPYNNMKYTRFLMHQNCWCSPDSSSADKNMGLTIATAGYISEDGSSVVSLNSGYFPFGFITLESMSVGGTKL